jgi:hypothetical protein
MRPYHSNFPRGRTLSSLPALSFLICTFPQFRLLDSHGVCSSAATRETGLDPWPGLIIHEGGLVCSPAHKSLFQETFQPTYSSESTIALTNLQSQAQRASLPQGLLPVLAPSTQPVVLLYPPPTSSESSQVEKQTVPSFSWNLRHKQQ